VSAIYDEIDRVLVNNFDNVTIMLETVAGLLFYFILFIYNNIFPI